MTWFWSQPQVAIWGIAPWLHLSAVQVAALCKLTANRRWDHSVVSGWSWIFWFETYSLTEACVLDFKYRKYIYISQKLPKMQRKKCCMYKSFVFMFCKVRLPEVVPVLVQNRIKDLSVSDKAFHTVWGFRCSVTLPQKRKRGGKKTLLLLIMGCTNLSLLLLRCHQHRKKGGAAVPGAAAPFPWRQLWSKRWWLEARLWCVGEQRGSQESQHCFQGKYGPN